MQETPTEGLSGSSDAPSAAFDADAIVPRRSRLSLLAAIVRRSPSRSAGAGLALVAVLAALIGAWFTPYSPIDANYTAILGTPTRDHLFGTDQVGRDVFSRVLGGAHLSLQVAAVVVLVGAAVGMLIGLVSGYAGGIIDEILMRITDIFLAFPALVVALALASSLGASLTNMALSLMVVWWPYYARLIRGQVLGLREREYVEAARAAGVGHWRLMWRHILPNSLTPLIVQMSLDVGFAILAVSSLSFIGLGAQPPTPEWGTMIADAQSYVRSAWWVAAFPGLAITLTVIGFNLLADLLQSLLDPRLQA
jgi:peptide/nickel transport system permease protein